MPVVLFEPEAEAEVREAAVWYEARTEGLGRRFLDEVERVVTTIGRLPSRFPCLMDPNLEIPVRRALLRRFPYALVFVEYHAEARVIAAAHAQRTRGYWIHRIRTY